MDSKRANESPEKYSAVLKKRRTVSPVKQKPFDALKLCQKICCDLLTNPKHHPYATIFYQPVDPVQLQCPDYYNVIKYPMDLSTIQKKLDDGCYKDEDDFASDVRIMVQNCFTFNGMDHVITPWCQKFSAVFEERFSRVLMAKEKSKITIFDKLDKKEKEVKAQIEHHQLMLSHLNIDLERIQHQRMEEQEKLLPKVKDPVVVKKKVKKIKNAPKKEPEKKLEEPVHQEQDAGKINSDSEEDDSAPSMTYDELRKLSSEINKLPTDNLIEVIEIVKKYEKSVHDDDTEEIEIDFDQLKPITLRTLEQYLINQKKPKPVEIKRGKGKTVDLSEQEKTLKKELENIDDQLGLKKKVIPVKTPSPVRSASSSSSGDSSSGSSSDSSDSLSSSAED